MAPIPGETKIWQYITLMKRIYLIDCPGVVPPNNHDSPEDILLRGVVRVENVENPEQYIAAVLRKAKPQHIERTYDVKGYKTPLEFLEILARKGGRLLKGGEADVDGVAKIVLNDFLRGKIPWFTPPPILEGQEEKGIEGRKGVLGEMGKVRKPEDAPSISVSGVESALSSLDKLQPETGKGDQEEFDGFNDKELYESEDNSQGTSSQSDDEESSANEGLSPEEQSAPGNATKEAENDSSRLEEHPPRSLKRRRNS